MRYHKQLERQIRKHVPDTLLGNASLASFFDAINESYNAYDRDMELSSRAFQLSEIEYRELNQKLVKEVEQKKLSITKLKDSLLKLDPLLESESTKDSDDIFLITEFFTEQLQKKKEAEQELLKSAHIIHSLVQNLHTGILVEDENRNIVLANQLFCDIFKFPVTADQIIGTSCANMAEEAKPYFKDPELFEERLNKLLIDKQIVIAEEIELADGRIIERDFIPIPIDGIKGALLWKFRDITDKKLTEQKLRLKEEKYRGIIANMNLGLIEVDLEDNIQYVNKSFSQMCGYSEDELLHKNASTLFMREKGRAIIKEKNESRTKGVSDAYEVEVHDKSGNKKWWLISGAPLYDNTRMQTGSIGIHLDISMQKQLELELKEAKENAENSAAAKEHFLTNMSHEIRTPMNAIIGMGRQLNKTPLSSEQATFLTAINNAADNLLVIINDILDFAKIEAGKVSLECIGFELDELIDHIIQINQHKAEEKGLRLSARVDKALEPVFIGDPYRINQVLINLVSNAIKFTEKGMVEISCQMIENRQASQTVEFSVTDTGIGMGQAFLEKIFQKFTQEDESVTRQYGGTGLGMGICKQLVELMGGIIKISSNKNTGTTVNITIELPKGSVNDLPTKQTTATNIKTLIGKTVLLVEDNEMNRIVASTILDQQGCIVAEAKNGKEAIEYLKNHHVDVVLMDMRMPVMDGLQATRVIRESISKELTVIALTANAIKGEQEKCIAAGMNDYLVKPFEEEDLTNILAKWLEKKVSLPSTEQPKLQPAKLYDLSKLQSISRGNDEFVKRMLSVFIRESTKAVESMKAALIENDAETISQTAHRIKPSFENLGIHTVRQQVLWLEAMKNTTDSKQASTCIQEIEKVMESVIGHLSL